MMAAETVVEEMEVVGSNIRNLYVVDNSITINFNYVAST